MSGGKRTKVEVKAHHHKDKNGSRTGVGAGMSHNIGPNTKIHGNIEYNRGSGNQSIGGTVGLSHEF